MNRAIYIPLFLVDLEEHILTILSQSHDELLLIFVPPVLRRLSGFAEPPVICTVDGREKVAQLVVAIRTVAYCAMQIISEFGQG